MAIVRLRVDHDRARAQTIPRSVTLFLTEDQERATPFLERKWRKAARELEVQHIPGDHLTCIATFGHALTEKLRTELAHLNSLVSVLFSLRLLADFDCIHPWPAAL